MMKIWLYRTRTRNFVATYEEESELSPDLEFWISLELAAKGSSSKF